MANLVQMEVLIHVKTVVNAFRLDRDGAVEEADHQRNNSNKRIRAYASGVTRAKIVR